ncbi:hypothetical protein I5W30_04620 [Stenotrophomonas maltophilia]|nr:hypothetical protein [Stenotrophomonas maltophilia]
MTTDKTPATLATVKHGGCVQLGDGLLPCPFCGNGAEFVPYKNNGLTLKCKSMGCIQRHQRTLRYGIEWLRTSMTEHWNTRSLAALPSPADALPDIESWSKGYDSGYARAVADFAASQRVVQITDTEIDARLNALYREMVDSGQHNGGMSGVAWDRAVFRMASKQHAQAVDFGRFRQPVEFFIAYTFPGTPSRAEGERLLALIDRTAVGNG